VLNPAPMHAGLDSGLLALCNVITPNETEFSMLLANILGERMAADDIADSTDEILHALCRRLGVPTVVITLGARGCFVSHDSAARRGDERDFYRMQAERVTGALVACLAQSPEPAFQQAVRHANRVAGLSTERVGAALAVPSLAEVKARFPEPC
jgi:ribokinase